MTCPGIEIKCLRCGSFNSFLERSVDQIIITDPNGVILFANKAVVVGTLYSIKEIVGKTPALWGGNMSKEFYQNLWQTIKNEKKTFLGVVRNVKKNGESYLANLRISPVTNISGEIQFFVGIENKIPHQKQTTSS